MIEYMEWFVIAFPLLSGLLNALGGQRFSRQTQNWLAFGGAVGAVVAWLPLCVGQVLAPDLAGLSESLTWIKMWDGQRFIEGPLRLYIDGWSVWMALIVAVLGMWGLAWTVTRPDALNNRPRWLELALIDGLLATILLVVLADNLWTVLLGWSIAGWLLSKSSSTTWRFWFWAGDLGLLLAIGFLAPGFVNLSVDSLPTLPTAEGHVGGIIPIDTALPVARSLLIWALMARFGALIPALGGQNRRNDLVLALFFALPGNVVWLHRLSSLLFPLTVWEILLALLPAGLIWLLDKQQMRLIALGQIIVGWEEHIARIIGEPLDRLLQDHNRARRKVQRCG